MSWSGSVLVAGKNFGRSGLASLADFAFTLAP